jgi:NADH dehydrogenase
MSSSLSAKGGSASGGKSPSLHTDIAILGAGIGGYEVFVTLTKLLKRHRLPARILIIDHNNYFSFTPLNHEVASGAVEPTHAALPLRELVRGTPHQFLKTDIKKIDPVKKIITTGRGQVHYEQCVVALGSSTNYYNTPGAEEFSHHVRTLAGAMILRHNIMEALESHDERIDITVVGGGYTGVEVAGQLMHFANHDARELYPEKAITVRLVQTGGTVVPQLPVKAQQKIISRLKKMGVEILFNTRVKEVKLKSVVTESDELLSDFTVWCAGFGNVANCFLNLDYCTKDNRIPTNGHLQHPDFSTLYAVGDIGLIFNPGETVPVPQLGEAAYHQGQYVAQHIFAGLRGKQLPPFKFITKGTLMPIGERYGIGVVHGVVFGGILAWWMRRTVYLTFMPGLLRKLRIVVDWTLRLFGFSYTIAVERNLEHGPKNMQYNPKFNS